MGDTIPRTCADKILNTNIDVPTQRTATRIKVTSGNQTFEYDTPKIETVLASKEDDINHPSRYTSGGVECIDFMRKILGDEETINFCIANVIKYLWRRDMKDGDKDVKKACWYMDEARRIANDNKEKFKF